MALIIIIEKNPTTKKQTSERTRRITCHCPFYKYMLYAYHFNLSPILLWIKLNNQTTFSHQAYVFSLLTSFSERRCHLHCVPRCLFVLHTEWKWLKKKKLELYWSNLRLIPLLPNICMWVSFHINAMAEFPMSTLLVRQLNLEIC